MKLLIFILLMAVQTSVYADNVFNSQVQNTQSESTLSRNSIVSTTEHIGTAKDWDLTETEWKRYLDYMQGPSGHYYATLSPPEVLGINAESQEDLKHYAVISAKQEHDKLERELKFNLAFHDAAMQLYSSEPLIKPFDNTAFNPKP